MPVQGPFKVDFADVFPHGAFARNVEPVRDWEASTPTAFVQARDKDTGMPAWIVVVVDGDTESREAAWRVKISAPLQPVLPEPVPGTPFRPCVLDGLQLMPWLPDGARRISFSVRATGVRPVTSGSPARSERPTGSA